MMEKGFIHMIDAKAAAGTAATTLSAWATWAEPVVGLIVTIVVGGLTAWYTWERANKLRNERKNRSKK
jgi:Na+/H+-translocating membrane pyrophosphatase